MASEQSQPQKPLSAKRKRSIAEQGSVPSQIPHGPQDPQQVSNAAASSQSSNSATQPVANLRSVPGTSAQTRIPRPSGRRATQLRPTPRASALSQSSRPVHRLTTQPRPALEISAQSRLSGFTNQNAIRPRQVLRGPVRADTVASTSAQPQYTLQASAQFDAGSRSRTQARRTPVPRLLQQAHSSKENAPAQSTPQRKTNHAVKANPAFSTPDPIVKHQKGFKESCLGYLNYSPAKQMRPKKKTVGLGNSSANDPNINTPMRPKTSGVNHMSSKSTDVDAHTKLYKEEVERYVQKRLSFDIKGLVELAAPVYSELRNIADDYATKIAKRFENTLASKSLSEDDEYLFGWIRKGAKINQEKELYGYFAKFLEFVARNVVDLNHKPPFSKHRPKRVVEAFDKHDVKIDGAEQNYRPDIVVECTPIDQSGKLVKVSKSPRPTYDSIFTIVEAKKTNSKSEVQSACIQLILYMREAYVRQWNRRFAWGLTLCGESVRVCNMGNDHLLVSPDMSLAQADGRAKLVKLLVYWSFCEEHRLGYDPTITWLPLLKCWQIDVPALSQTDSEHNSATSKRYYSQNTIAAADNFFGRHTRTFLATDTEPKCIADTDHKNCKFVVKDSWVESTVSSGDDTRDEIGHLHTIREKLKECEDVKGNYPTIVAGGRVRFDRSDGNGMVEDTTASTLGDVFTEVSDFADNSSSGNSGSQNENSWQVPFRVHKRVATTPVGKPLRYLDCPLKLAKVMADAMRAHFRIRWDANILHRDVSSNNILFYTTDDGDVHGLLIDFDHAIDVSVAKTTRHLDRSGTLPFMSINNLAGNVQWVSGLDDWESALYMLVWIGTYGFNQTLAQNSSELDKLEIKLWCAGPLSNIAASKRNNMDSVKSFRRLTSQFLSKLPKSERLEELVHDLHVALIRNPELGPKFHGAHLEYQGYGKNKISTDPFEMRKSKERKLMESLLQVMEDFVNQPELGSG